MHKSLNWIMIWTYIIIHLLHSLSPSLRWCSCPPLPCFRARWITSSIKVPRITSCVCVSHRCSVSIQKKNSVRYSLQPFCDPKKIFQVITLSLISNHLHILKEPHRKLLILPMHESLFNAVWENSVIKMSGGSWHITDVSNPLWLL